MDRFRILHGLFTLIQRRYHIFASMHRNLLRGTAILLALSLFSTTCLIQAQGTVFGVLLEHLDNSISAMPGASGNQYQNPSQAEIADFKTAITLIESGQLAEAHMLAASLEYEVVRFIDHTLTNNQEFIILQKQPGGTNYWGTLIYNHNACRDLVIQCPHPRLDSNTGLQGAYIFTRLKARAMMLSGTHRCNSTTASSCSGSTSVCGSSAKYRISDIAHNDKSMFQEMTRALSVTDPDLIFLQLHGFARLSGDPHLIMSNGTRETPVMDPIGTLRQSLQAIDATLTFKIAHVHTDWTRLIGFTNTQGRLLNHSPDACSANASTSEGLFMHVEQEFDSFRADEDGWDLMYRGLEEAFVCTSTATAEITPPSYRLSGGHIAFALEGTERYLLEIYTYDGRRLQGVYAHPDVWYQLPYGSIAIVVLRSLETGIPVFQRKFFFAD